MPESSRAPKITLGVTRPVRQMRTSYDAVAGSLPTLLLGGAASSYGTVPLCGDRITLYVRLENEVITDVGFEGTGCAIFKASASLMTQALKGKTKAEAEALFDKVHRMLTGELDPSANGNQLGKLAVFSGVCEFPARVKCATLAWHTLRAALAAKNEVVSTE